MNHIWAVDREAMRALCNARLAAGTATWVDVVREEYYESLAEEDWKLARPEIIQLMAMCLRTVLDCDQKASGLPPKTFGEPRGPNRYEAKLWEDIPLPLEHREFSDRQETHGDWPPNAG